MKYNLTKHDKNWNNSVMISVSDNSVYFSRKVQTQLNIKPRARVEFSYDKENIAIGVKIAQDDDGYKLNSIGYCKVRIGTQMPIGRYFYQNNVEGIFIFQKK